MIFCIIKNKKENTYNNLFTTVKRLIPGLRPTHIKIDFELAAINAIKKNFPFAQLSSCQFHLGQIIQRKLKELNLFKQYKLNIVVKKFIKSLLALAFVEPCRIKESFESLKSHPEFPNSIILIYDFFYKNYICEINAKYDINLWNSLILNDYNVPKTNNAIEAWHMVFKSAFGTSRYNFHLLILKLKEEEEVIQQKYLRIQAGEILPRNKIYIENEQKLKDFLSEKDSKHGVQYIFELINLIHY